MEQIPVCLEHLQEHEAKARERWKRRYVAHTVKHIQRLIDHYPDCKQEIISMLRATYVYEWNQP